MLLRFEAWKVTLIMAALILGALLVLPNFASLAPYTSWLPTGPMKLGLDLRGGASILLEVDPVELETNRMRELSRDVRGALSQRPGIISPQRNVVDKPNPAANSPTKELQISLRDAADMAEAIRRIERLGNPPVGAIGVANTLDVRQAGADRIVISLTREALDKLRADALSNSMEAVRRRVDNSGTVEPNIQKQGDNRIIVEVPGLDDPTSLIDVITQAGVLTFNLVDVQASPADYEPNVPRNGRLALPDDSLNGQVQVIFEDPIITGADLQSASQSFDQNNRPAISFQLRPAGAQRFGKTTTDNVGTPFAIVLDNRIVSAPNIRSPITGGSGVIEGSFTLEEAENLAVVLRSGALPAKLQVAERRLVGAGLGADSIRMGVTASVIGVALVAAFMIAAYGLLGVFAVIALLCNLFLMMGVLSLLGATLTLPGIAGILLTMGMAVDYNVLIFERIREEKRNGRAPVSSVEVGYKEAMATIIDANVTHLVAALVMFNLGSGPVRGFALTLAIGIITSFFTAVIVARLIMSVWLKTARPRAIPI
ncbi:MAG: protein translocase subunit SecD [Alphaproteobacteria bacterium]|nr:protein translocase subunit SecD [Alphaproteobacteria bacterium]